MNDARPTTSAPPSPQTRSTRTARIALLVAVALLLVAAQRLGLLQRFADPAGIKRTLLDLGPLGYIAFVVAFAALQPFGLPGTVFVMAAPLVWSWPIAFALSMIGTMAASSVGFGFARFVARDWISKKIPHRFRKYDDALARNAFLTVFLLRIVFWMPPLLHAFFGVSRVRFWTHFWASFCGYLLPLFLMSFFGQRLWALVKRMPMSAWLALAAVAVALALIVWIRRRRTMRRDVSVADTIA